MTVPRSSARIRERHEARANGARYPEIDEELAAAWHSLQLHWLRSVPGYREEVRQRVAEAARHAERRARWIETGQRVYMKDVDLLGQEIEGCG